MLILAFACTNNKKNEPVFGAGVYKGTYTVRVAASSDDTRLKGTFNLGRSLTVRKESVALKPQVKINELKPR